MISAEPAACADGGAAGACANASAGRISAASAAAPDRKEQRTTRIVEPRRKCSVRVIETATYVGLVMLLALMTWVMYLDIGRLIGQ